MIDTPKGYKCTYVSWEDSSRDKGLFGGVSGSGSNITDVRLKGKNNENYATIRSDNWDERVGKVSAQQVALIDNNEPETLASWLKKNGLYSPELDTEIIIRFQTCFLPNESEFCVEHYNYQTKSDNDPKNLLLLCTTQGVMLDQDGPGYKRLFVLKQDPNTGMMYRHYLEVESTKHKVGGAQNETKAEREDALQRGKAMAAVIGTAAMGTRFNVLMSVQIPLKQQQQQQQQQQKQYQWAGPIFGFPSENVALLPIFKSFYPSPLTDLRSLANWDGIQGPMLTSVQKIGGHPFDVSFYNDDVLIYDGSNVWGCINPRIHTFPSLIWSKVDLKSKVPFEALNSFAYRVSELFENFLPPLNCRTIIDLYALNEPRFWAHLKILRPELNHSCPKYYSISSSNGLVPINAFNALKQILKGLRPPSSLFGNYSTAPSSVFGSESSNLFGGGSSSTHHGFGCGFNTTQEKETYAASMSACSDPFDFKDDIPSPPTPPPQTTSHANVAGANIAYSFLQSPAPQNTSHANAARVSAGCMFSQYPPQYSINANAARVSAGTKASSWTEKSLPYTGIKVKNPQRHETELITITCTIYYALPKRTQNPNPQDVFDATCDLEQLYKSCYWNGRLTDPEVKKTIKHPVSLFSSPMIRNFDQFPG